MADGGISALIPPLPGTPSFPPTGVMIVSAKGCGLDALVKKKKFWLILLVCLVVLAAVVYGWSVW